MAVPRGVGCSVNSVGGTKMSTGEEAILGAVIRIDATAAQCGQPSVISAQL